MNEDIKRSKFFKLYNNVHPRLYSFVLTVVHNSVDAEDILQETAALMWDRFDCFEEGTNFGAWAVTIARNKMKEFLRNRNKAQLLFDDSFYEQVSEYSSKTTNNVKDRYDALSICLNNLSINNKELLALRFKKSVPVKKISQMTGRSLNGLYQSYTLIFSKLRKCIDTKLAQQEM